MTAELVEDRIADVFDTARSYIHALDALEGADSKEYGAAQGRVQVALHDLALAARGECRMCDADTCPGYIT